MPQRLIHHLPFAVLSVNRRLRVMHANATAEDILGMSAAHLKKLTLQDIFIPHGQICLLVQSVFASGQPVKQYDFAISGPRLGEQWATLHLTPMDDEVLICLDIVSHSHTLSQSVVQRQHIMSQANMAAILAHEVKNPLAGIRGAAQLLQKTVQEEDKNLTTLICHETDRITKLISEMEFFSTPSQLKTEAVNIHEVLHYARSVTENGGNYGVSFVERFDPSLPSVQGNKDLLIQCFVNLFNNAIEATPHHCTIRVGTSFQSGIHLSSGNTKLPILITVEDNGGGIPLDLRERIFDPFITTKKTGKGLGLAIVAKIITDHNGVIELPHQPEKGARFQVMLAAA